MSDRVEVSATLGHTRYTLAEDSPGVLKLSRFNDDGRKDFYVPIKLVARYAVEKIARFRQAGVVSEIRSALGLR